jgi:cytoskeletal protein RodZ
MLIAHATVPSTANVIDRCDGLSDVGACLYDARMRQGISLTQVAGATHILPCYLAALETGAYRALPDPVRTRGFIRNYAQYLNIPAEELIALYQHEYGRPEPIRIVPVITPRSSRRLANFMGVGLVVVLLIATSYMVLSTLY